MCEDCSLGGLRLGELGAHYESNPEFDLDALVERSAEVQKLRKKLVEFKCYFARRRPFIVNYEDWYNNGKFQRCVESTVNELVSKRCVKQQ